MAENLDESNLNNDEEESLAEHLVEASIGYGKNVLKSSLKLKKLPWKKNILLGDKVTDGWWHRFKERQPKLSL